MAAKSLDRSVDLVNSVEKSLANKQLIKGCLSTKSTCNTFSVPPQQPSIECIPSALTTDKILLSISGGQDSICLLVILNQLSAQMEFKLGLVWCHHLWQIDSFSLMRQITKISYLFQLNSCFAITPKPIPSELLARNWRHDCSARICLFYNYYKMSLAHSASDKTETILLNLMRGTGVAGLSPLSWEKKNDDQVKKREHVSQLIRFANFKVFFFIWSPFFFSQRKNKKAYHVVVPIFSRILNPWNIQCIQKRYMNSTCQKNRSVGGCIFFAHTLAHAFAHAFAPKVHVQMHVQMPVHMHAGQLLAVDLYTSGLEMKYLFNAHRISGTQNKNTLFTTLLLSASGMHLWCTARAEGACQKRTEGASQADPKMLQVPVASVQTKFNSNSPIDMQRCNYASLSNFIPHQRCVIEESNMDLRCSWKLEKVKLKRKKIDLTRFMDLGSKLHFYSTTWNPFTISPTFSACTCFAPSAHTYGEEADIFRALTSGCAQHSADPRSQIYSVNTEGHLRFSLGTKARYSHRDAHRTVHSKCTALRFAPLDSQIAIKTAKRKGANHMVKRSVGVGERQTTANCILDASPLRFAESHRTDEMIAVKRLNNFLLLHRMWSIKEVKRCSTPLHLSLHSCCPLLALLRSQKRTEGAQQECACASQADYMVHLLAEHSEGVTDTARSNWNSESGHQLMQRKMSNPNSLLSLNSKNWFYSISHTFLKTCSISFSQIKKNSQNLLLASHGPKVQKRDRHRLASETHLLCTQDTSNSSLLALAPKVYASGTCTLLRSQKRTEGASASEADIRLLRSQKRTARVQMQRCNYASLEKDCHLLSIKGTPYTYESEAQYLFNPLGKHLISGNQNKNAIRELTKRRRQTTMRKVSENYIKYPFTNFANGFLLNFLKANLCTELRELFKCSRFFASVNVRFQWLRSMSNGSHSFRYFLMHTENRSLPIASLGLGRSYVHLFPVPCMSNMVCIFEKLRRCRQDAQCFVSNEEVQSKNKVHNQVDKPPIPVATSTWLLLLCTCNAPKGQEDACACQKRTFNTKSKMYDKHLKRLNCYNIFNSQFFSPCISSFYSRSGRMHSCCALAMRVRFFTVGVSAQCIYLLRTAKVQVQRRVCIRDAKKKMHVHVTSGQQECICMCKEDAFPYIHGFHSLRCAAQQELESSEICELYLEKNPSTIRPLLALNRFDISKLCIYWELPVYPDQSNQKMSFLRNRVRKQLLPTIKLFFNSRIENVLLQFAEIFYDEDHYINQITNKLFYKLGSASTFAHSPPIDGYYDQTLLPIDSPLYTSGLEVQHLLDAHQISETQNKNALVTTCSCECTLAVHRRFMPETDYMVHLLASHSKNVTKKALCTEDASWSSHWIRFACNIKDVPREALRRCKAQRFTECIFFAPSQGLFRVHLRCKEDSTSAHTFSVRFACTEGACASASQADPKMEPSSQPLKRGNAHDSYAMRRSVRMSATLYTCNIAYATRALHYSETSEKVSNQIHFTGCIFFAHALLRSQKQTPEVIAPKMTAPKVIGPKVIAHAHSCVARSGPKVQVSASGMHLRLLRSQKRTANSCGNESAEKFGASNSYVSLYSQKLVSVNHYTKGTKATLLQANAIFECEIFAVSLHFFRFSLFSIKRRRYIVVPKMYLLRSQKRIQGEELLAVPQMSFTCSPWISNFPLSTTCECTLAVRFWHAHASSCPFMLRTTKGVALQVHSKSRRSASGMHMHLLAPSCYAQPKVWHCKCTARVPGADYMVHLLAEHSKDVTSASETDYLSDDQSASTNDADTCTKNDCTWTCTLAKRTEGASASEADTEGASACPSPVASYASLVFLRGTEKISQAVWNTPIIRGKRQKQITFNYFISYLYSKGVADRLIMHIVHHDQLTFNLLWTEIKLNGHYVTPSSAPSGLLLFKRLYKNCQASSILYPIKAIPRYSLPMGATFWVWNRKLHKTKKFSRISTSYLSIKSNSLFSFYQRWLTECFAEQQCTHTPTFFSRSSLSTPNGDCIFSVPCTKGVYNIFAVLSKKMHHVIHLAPTLRYILGSAECYAQPKVWVDVEFSLHLLSTRSASGTREADLRLLLCTEGACQKRTARARKMPFKGAKKIHHVIRFWHSCCALAMPLCTKGHGIFDAPGEGDAKKKMHVHARSGPKVQSKSACREGLSRSAHMKDASDKSLVYLLNVYNKQKNILLSTLNKPYSWHRNSASISKRKIIITSLAFSMSARRAGELPAFSPERVESSLHLWSASSLEVRAGKINRAGGEWVRFACIFSALQGCIFRALTSSEKADLVLSRCKEDSTLVHTFGSTECYAQPKVWAEARPFEGAKKMHHRTCEVHLFLSAKVYCKGSVGVKVPTPISHSSPIALGYYLKECRGQVDKPEMERLPLKIEDLITNHNTFCLRLALIDCRFPCSNALGESSEATIGLALPIPLELSARIAIGRFFAPTVMEGRWKDWTWELGKIHKTCILDPRIAHSGMHLRLLRSQKRTARVQSPRSVGAKKKKKNTNKLVNIFSKFDKLEIEKKEIYWPLIISFLPKAIQRRFIKLFLINQNSRQVRYSQIEQFLSIIKKS